MAEDLVLGLEGGLRYDATLGKIAYDPSTVGLGPAVLNPAAPRRYSAYIEPRSLSWRMVAGAKSGQYVDDSGSANDSVIPEFVDRFPSPMPILYLRAKAGAPTVAPTGPNDNSIITNNGNNTGGTFRAGQYDISQVLPYTGPDSSGHYIGEGKTVPWYYANGASVATPNPPAHGLQTVKAPPTPAVMGPKGATGYDYPYDAYPYFTNPSIPNTARAKDGFILISAGADRVYGTNDDITTFGDVAP